MRSKSVERTLLATTLAGVIFSSTISVVESHDFGAGRENRLHSYVNQMSSFIKPLGTSALPTTGPFRTLI